MNDVLRDVYRILSPRDDSLRIRSGACFLPETIFTSSEDSAAALNPIGSGWVSEFVVINSLFVCWLNISKMTTLVEKKVMKLNASEYRV